MSSVRNGKAICLSWAQPPVSCPPKTYVGSNGTLHKVSKLSLHSRTLAVMKFMSPLRALLLAQLLVYVSPAGGNHIHIFFSNTFFSFSFRYNLWLILLSKFSRELYFLYSRCKNFSLWISERFFNFFPELYIFLCLSFQ